MSLVQRIRNCRICEKDLSLGPRPIVQLTLVIGQYAQAWHLDDAKKNLTETVRAWRDYGESMFPLPHPSPRNNIWLAKNRWFEKELIPELKNRIRKLI